MKLEEPYIFLLICSLVLKDLSFTFYLPQHFYYQNTEGGAVKENI